MLDIVSSKKPSLTFQVWLTFFFEVPIVFLGGGIVVGLFGFVFLGFLFLWLVGWMGEWVFCIGSA